MGNIVTVARERLFIIAVFARLRRLAGRRREILPGPFTEWREAAGLGRYMWSGASMPIRSRARRNTIWADSTNLSLARVISSSSGLDDTTRQFS